tara:strand:+ start:103 stop:1146 length:1044 start_codon:yes stop_codon:yes gene_type:complete
LKKFLYLILLFFIIILIYKTSPLYFLYINKDKKEIISNSNKIILTVKNDISFNELGNFLVQKNILKKSNTFNELVVFKNYDNDSLKKGKYTLDRNWTNNQLINQLFIMRNQNITDLYIPSSRNLKTICAKISNQINIDSSILFKIFNDETFQNRFGFNSYTFPTIIIPNTYEVYSNITEHQLLDLFRRHYKIFWNSSRIKKAKNIGLTQSEVTILASIVQMEQQLKFDEHAKIAGLYINRLKKGMKLQADPTVKFALNKPDLRRLYYRHLEVDSPYNTYKFKGLPPGPIWIPDSRVIDAVLDYEPHDYIFMCAQPSYSGYHNFSSNNSDHEKYKKDYTNWLSKEGIN